jgi:hypothetical protein
MKTASFFFALIFFSAGAAAGGPAVNFTADNEDLAVGGTVSVALVMSDFPVSQGGGLNLLFDPRVVQVGNVFVDKSIWNFSHQNGQVDNTAGRVDDIVFAAFPGVAGAGKIATIELRGLKKGNARLRLEGSDKNPFSSNGESFPVSLGRSNLRVK